MKQDMHSYHITLLEAFYAQEDFYNNIRVCTHSLAPFYRAFHVKTC